MLDLLICRVKIAGGLMTPMHDPIMTLCMTYYDPLIMQQATYDPCMTHNLYITVAQ